MSSDAPAHTWTPVPDWVMFSGISTPAFRLYCALLMRVNRQRGDGLTWPSLETLAAMTGFKNRQSLARYLTELQDMGAVVVTVKTHRGGRQNLYWIREDPPDDAAFPCTVAEFDEMHNRGSQPHGDDPIGRSQPSDDDPSQPHSDDGSHADSCENKTNGNHTNGTRRTSTPVGVYDYASSVRERFRDEMKVYDHGVFDDPDEADRGQVEHQLIKSVMKAIPAHGHVRAEDARDKLQDAFRECRAQAVPVKELRGLVDRVLSEITSGTGNGNVLVDHGPF